MAASEQAEVLTIEPARLASIAYHVVGVHTEGGRTPYTGAANAGGASGLSIGTMQHDFGQRPTTAPGYASAIVDWYTSNDKSISFTAAQLATGILKKSLTPEQRVATADFGASSEGAKWIYDNLEKSHVDAAVRAAQQAFATPYGQAVLAEGTHVEEFAAFSMKVFNQYGGGPIKINGEVSDYKFPGFQGLLAYLNKGQVELRDNRSGHDGETVAIAAGNPEQFDRDDLLAFSRGYASTRSNQSETNSPALGDNRAIISGPLSALSSGALYSAILDSDSPLSDVLRRVEGKGDFSPTLVTSDPDVALARAMFGADTGRMKSAVAAINDATTLDPVSVSAPLGQYPGTLWIDPLSGRIALSYKDSSSGFVVNVNGYAKFTSSAVVKDDGVRTLQIGEGDAAVGFDQIATPLANSPLPREAVAPATLTGGYWYYPTYSDEMGNSVSVPGERIWIPDATTTAGNGGTTASAAGTVAAPKAADAAAEMLPQITTIPGAAGEPLTFKLGNEKLIRAGDDLDSADGRLVAFNQADDALVIDFKVGENLYERRTYNASGKVTTQAWEYAKDQTDASTGDAEQYFNGDVYKVAGDKYIFVTGRGLLHQGTGELAATTGEIRQFILTKTSAVDSHDPIDPYSIDAVNGHDHQSDNYLNVINLPAPELASHFAGGNAGGAYGAGTLGGFDVLPLNGGVSFLVNADGDIAGEVNRLPNGDLQIKNLYGEAVYVNQAGAVLSQQDYQQAQQAQQAQQDALTQAQYNQAASAIGLMNSIIGLQHWDNMGDLQRLAAVTSIYNVLDKMSGGEALPGNLGTAASALGLLNALDQGNVGGIAYSGLSLVEHLTYDAATKMGLVSDTLGGNFLPGLGFVLALDSGDPVSIASSGLSLMSSLGYIGPWGAVAAVVIVLLGAMFEDDIPMKEGLAHAEWDAQGNTQVITDQDTEGGGATATGWMNSIVAGLQAQLAATQDAAGNSYALIPNLLPAIGYQYDPDGFNYGSASGHMYLKWTDAQGNSQTRYYDGQGNREDGTGETLASDFMEHAQGAIAPAWQVATVLAHWQLGQGIQLPNGQAGLPQELADDIHQTLQALTLELPSPPVLTNGLIDIDADGYLEKTQWLAANQQILAIDANGDGQIGAGELLHINGGSALNSLSWLDANKDQVLDASDPAFGALRLWMDINSDGNSQGETQTLSQAAITAIDFGSNPPAVIRSDGSRTILTAQTLTGDVLGVRYTATAGGVLEAQERGETVLHAVNTREFDGQSGHIQGGAPDTDGTAGGQAVLINAQDSRLSTTTARTLANRPVFVPIAATTQAQAQREVTAAMVRSAESTLFGATSGAAPLVALALGAGAMQWPVVATAALSPVQADGNALSATDQAKAAGPTPNLESTATTVQAEPVEALRQAQGERLDAAGIELSALQAGRVITGVQPTGGEGLASSGIDASNQALDQAGQAQAATDSVANQTSSSAATASSSDAVGGLSATLLGSAGTDGGIQLTYPTVTGELVAGTEDIGLHIAATLLLANDSTLNAGDPSRPLLSISAVGSPTHGQVALRINEAGATEVVFIPEANYHGPASFVYTVTDQYGLSTVATATLDIASVNDAPTPVADAASGDEDATLMFTAASLLSNDFDMDSAVDGDVLRITRVGLAEHGQVFLQADGNIRFVPDLHYNGPAQFSYWVADRSEAAMATQYGGAIPGGVGLESPGTMHLTVLPVNDLPMVTGEAIASDEDMVLTINPALLLANDSDVDTASNGQVLTISAVSGAQHGAVILLANGTIQFTPEQDYFGPASFVYTVDDGNGGQVQGTAVVNLASVNDVPVVNDELLIGKRDAAYTLSQAALLANDTDLETPGGLSIVSVQGMSHGTVVLNVNGSVTFTPEPGYSGRGRFEYVVQDADGGQAVAATEIDFAAININPIATNDSFTGFEDIAFVIQANQLLANDADPDASGLAVLTVDAVRNASHGTVSLQADGSVRFDPVANFYGAASFEYRTNDGEGGQTWATAYLNVQSVNDAPVITSIWYASGDDSTFYMGESTLTSDDPYRQGGGIVAYDPDGDSAALTVSIGSGPQHGHAWANVVIPISAPSMTHESAPNFFVPQAGAWTYFSHFGDPYSGADPFTVSVTDSGGASTTAMIYAAHQGSSAGGGGKCPIVIDLNGDGIELIRPEDSDIFADVNGDGWRERIGWAADEDGVLTFDANRDGRITDNAEVSFVGYKEGARTDLDGLAAFDTDGDGKLNAGDAAWSQFGVLCDANGNGSQDEGELVSLDQLGITAIGLQRQGNPRLDNGNVVFGTTDVMYADGRIGEAGDVMFAGENVPLPAAVQAVLPPLPPPTGEDDVARLALLMSQYGALAEGLSEPLGFVDWSEASPTQSPAEAMASALVQTDHFGTSSAGGA